MSYFGIPIRNGLPIGLGSVAPLASGGGSPFSPLSLFSGGAPGAWYDPSDLTTLFQDSAGTTPVTAVEQPVGLMLDKSQGLVLGSELVTNGDFSGGTTGWVSGTSLSSTAAVVSGEMQVTATASSGRQIQGITTTTGKSYKVTGLIRKISGGGVAAYLAHTDAIGSSNFSISNTVSGSVATAVTLTFTATASTSYIALSCWNSGDVCGFDNISVKELPGNHAFQSTSASRPVLSARYNLLTKTEQFDNAAWTKTGGITVTANATTAPDGTTTADSVITGAALATQRVGQITTASGACKFSFYAKPNGYEKIGIWDYATTGAYAAFNLTGAGAVLDSGAGASGAAIQALANGWYLLSFSATGSAVTGFGVQILPPSYTTGNVATVWTPNGTSGVFLWGADIRVANNGITQPAYQRVNTDTDYATTGFLPYLRFDGVDDSLSTNSISFTATDKMSVFAGVRKLSEVGAIIAELSVASATNNGSFTIFNSPSNTPGYGWQSSGTIRASAEATSGYVVPITNTLTGLGDISGDRAALRINGTQVAQSTADQGTGNYGNYPLYIGRRGGSSLPFNGQMYSMIIVGKAVTAGELSSTETYVNQKTGAY